MLKIRYTHLVFLFSFLVHIPGFFSQVIYNAYANVTTISGTTFTVNNVNETNDAFAVNQQVIVMQMQDDVIGTNTTNVIGFGDLGAIKSAGLWEVATVQSLTRSAGVLQTVTFSGALANTYTVGTNASLQIITFRTLSAAAFTSSANITGLAWNGFVGGVVALRVGTIFTLGHTISASGIGFRGGAKNNPNFASTSCETAFINAIGNKWAGKGEGIYKNTNANFDGARAKILTGGGGGTDENSGGGGGGHYTVGGTGGPGYNGTTAGCNPGVGALGGITLSTSISGSRIFMGGGGGGGHENNSVGTPGGAGGGIILLKTGTLTTTGSCGSISITANGASVPNAGNDGSGGGGAAGSIVLNVNTFSIASSCSLIINANGGQGGTCGNASTHSGGGGGAQGVVLYSTAQPTTNMVTTTSNGVGGCNNSGCSTSAGSASGNNNAGIFSMISTPLPVELRNFTGTKAGKQSLLTWSTLSEKNSSHFELERTTDGNTYISLVSIPSRSSGGNSSTLLEYKYADLYPEQGINYYRLKLVDLDKTFKYSHVVEINHGEFIQLKDLAVYPNPSTGSFYLTVKNSSLTDQALNIELSDVWGRKLESNQVRLSSAEPIEIAKDLLPGCYILKLKNDSQELFFKLVVN